MQVEVFPLGPLETNSFLLCAEGQAVAVDVGGDPSRMLSKLKKDGLALSHVLITHLHFDHILGVKRLAEATGAQVMAGEADRFLFETEVGAGGMAGLPRVQLFDFQAINPGSYEFIGQKCEVLATPGHSLGSLSFYFPEAQCVFAGDLIFARSVGRTDLPGGDFDTLNASVREKIFSLPAKTRIYSGHGPSSTVGDEKAHNPFFAPHGGW